MSSATTASPFLRLFALTSFDRAGTAAHCWLAEHRAEAWLSLSASHLVHLGQIGLYHRLGENCPLMVWLFTIPVWLAGGVASGRPWIAGPYTGGLWIMGLVILLVFALGSAGAHLLAYNLPALVLFLAAALGLGLPPLRRVLAAERLDPLPLRRAGEPFPENTVGIH